ncbi:hypothetical protein CLOM621_06036 [Clostridium sp. M62/1]|nr:hypothetical protein CLOM621_06036 [Clostridium sp. M62/1]CBK78342.1 hypothetical protein CLS_30640 [[Clostridium] cf. saccharolyticum K10]
MKAGRDVPGFADCFHLASGQERLALHVYRKKFFWFLPHRIRLYGLSSIF